MQVKFPEVLGVRLPVVNVLAIHAFLPSRRETEGGPARAVHTISRIRYQPHLPVPHLIVIIQQTSHTALRDQLYTTHATANIDSALLKVVTNSEYVHSFLT